VGYGDKAPVRWTGRFLAGLVIIVALPLFALFTAELASTFTLHEIDSRIRGPNDLVGRSVGVVRGTTSVRAGVEAGARVIQYETATEAYAALHERLVEAVVYDVPSLRYQSQQPGNERLAVVGAAFRPQQLAIAVAEDSPLREKLNRALLRLEENGRLSEIRTHWFGQ
jgi:ABC-type amino acid transport substrate-binding protein